MSYEYGSESKRLELPNPYQLQNRLLWLCGAVLLIVAGVDEPGLGASSAMQDSALRLAGAPLVAGIAAARRRPRLRRRRPPAGCASSSAAAGRRRSRPRSRSARPAARRPPTRSRRSCARAASPTPSRRAPIEGVLYHWAPTLITAPREVQALARRYMFNLAAIAATLVSFLFSWAVFGNEATRPWIGILYFAFGVFFLLRPVLTQHRARLTTASLVGLIAAAILGAGRDRPGRAAPAAARRLLAERADLRDARHRAGRLRRWRWRRCWRRSTARRRRARASSRTGSR